MFAEMVAEDLNEQAKAVCDGERKWPLTLCKICNAALRECIDQASRLFGLEQQQWGHTL
jgi:hypothetical protein